MKAEVQPSEAIATDELPPGWRMATIGELLKVRNGFAFKSVDYQEEGALLIRQSNLDGSRVTVEKAKYLPKPYLEEFRDYLIRKGDILIGMSGSIGKLCTYDRDEPALQNQRTGLLVFKDPEQKPWVWHYLPLLEKELVKVGKGVAVQNVSASQIESFPIPVAPLDQQKRIVAEIEKQFSRLDEAVANLKRVKANLKHYKAAVLKAAVEGRLVETEAERARREGRSYETGEQLLQRILETRRNQWQGKGKYKEPAAPDTTNLPELPEGWTWVRLDSIAALKGGITVDSKRQDPTARTVPYLRVANVQRGYIDLAEVKFIDAPESEIEALRLLPGDILFNEGGDRDKLGRGWIWEGQLADCIHQNHVFRARLYLAQLSPKLVSWWGNSFGKDYFSREGKQTTNLASINLTKLSAFPVPLPPTAEQKEIVAEIDRRLSLADEAEDQVNANLQRAVRFRQSILSRAFSGKPHQETSAASAMETYIHG